MRGFDSYIFDMDGTLWDAVDSYCRVWDRTLADMGDSSRHVSRRELESLMGTPLDQIYDAVVGRPEIFSEFMARLSANEKALMPELGGKLYPGVEPTIRELAAGAKLFMVSNCEENGLPNFLNYTGLKPYFTDTLSYGQTGLDKDANIRTLVERYRLERPVYVGDTAGDLEQTHKAGLPFVWAAYGFGRDLRGYDYKIQSFSDLLTLER